MSAPASPWQAAEAVPAWRLASGDFPDVNVWLALSYTAHPFHAAASAYWETVCADGTPLWFSRSTMMALVRLLVQPRLMGANAMALHQAWGVYRQWLAAPGVGLLPDPAGLDDAIARLLGSAAAPMPPRLWTDLCLAATAEAAGLRLVTFDADFARFGLARHLLLKPATD